MSTPSGRQMFSDIYRYGGSFKDVCSDSIQSRSEKYLLWPARTSGANLFGHLLFVNFLFLKPLLCWHVQHNCTTSTNITGKKRGCTFHNNKPNHVDVFVKEITACRSNEHTKQNHRTRPTVLEGLTFFIKIIFRHF